MIGRFGAIIAVALFATQSLSEPIRVATFNIELVRDGPGLALRDLQRDGDPQIDAITAVIAATAPDILVLQGLDYDYGLETLGAFKRALAEPYGHLFARPTNRGLRTSFDADGDGRSGQAADAQGFGRFYGQGAMALLSRFPIDADRVQDFTDLLWKDAPGSPMPQNPDGTVFPSAEAAAGQRLSSSGHWIVPLRVGQGAPLTVMMFHASPPVFDGPEDRNGLRNAAEIGLWLQVLDGTLGVAPTGPFMIAGSANLDPYDSDGRTQTMRDLLSDPRVQDPQPQSDGGAQADPEGHIGANALDTVDWPGVGRLRVDYVLPSSDLVIDGSGVFWPPVGTDGHEIALRASRHRLVWVDVILPD